jgi:hypothetical protein
LVFFDFAGAALDFETALVACFFAGAGLRAGALALALVACLAAAAFFGAALFFGNFLADGAGLDGLADFLVLLLAEGAAVAFVALVALRAGAFSAGERLTIGLGRADLPVNVRLLAEDVGVVRRDVGLEGVLFTPLMLGTLMRSSQLSKKAAHLMIELPRNLGAA